MNANATLWIEALQSGNYAQTTHHLRQKSRAFWRQPAYCAMGVLYDVYLNAQGQKTWPATPPHGQLPEEVLEWAGISRGLECDVVGYNDVGMNFRDIASIIDAWFHRTERDRQWREAGRIAASWLDQARHTNHGEHAPTPHRR